jgi:hypothetical protein
MTIARCLALVCTVTVLMVCAAPALDGAGQRGGGRREAERRLSGIELEKTFPHELIPKWGAPTRIEDLNSGPVGELSYSWERAGVRLRTGVVYWTGDGRRCERPVYVVEVSGSRSLPDGFGATGCGLGLGDGLEKVRACYGTDYLDYRTRGGATTPDAWPAGTRIIQISWEPQNIGLEVVFGADGRIVWMKLRMLHI